MILCDRACVALILAVLTACVVLPANLPVEAQRKDNRALVVEQVKELPAKSKRFALVFGVDEYQDEQISRLSGAGNDAKALADALVRYAGFPADQVILLASDQPTQRQPNRGNILQYLSNLRGIVPEDGLLVVSFAGHGVERGGRGFLCPSDARIGGSIALLESTGVAVDTVREWIRETGVKQVLIILDACRNDPSGRGDTQNRLTDSFAQRFNFDVHNKEVTAFATLHATDVGHVAYEYKEKKQGYFTWTLVEGLKGGAANEKGEVTLGGLVRYLQEQVPKRVRLDMGQEKSQKPYATVGGYKADEFMGVANGFGLFDMHGNVFEWCLDYWHENYNGAPTDGRSWETAGDTIYRVLRSGSWNFDAEHCRSADRGKSNPGFRSLGHFGFRVVVAARTP